MDANTVRFLETYMVCAAGISSTEERFRELMINVCERLGLNDLALRLRRPSESQEYHDYAIASLCVCGDPVESRTFMRFYDAVLWAWSVSRRLRYATVKVGYLYGDHDILMLSANCAQGEENDNNN